MSAAPPRRDRVLATLAALVLTAGALFLEILALALYVFRCNEACSGSGGDWRDDASSWQWDLQLGWATVGLLLVVAAIPLAAGGRLRAAGAAAAASALTFAGWWGFAGSWVIATG